MNSSDYNLEYFRFIRDEITKRIQTHYRMVFAKIIIVGALLAFLLKGTCNIPVSPYVIPSIFALLMDVIILENLGWIRSAGAYVKKNIEDIDLPIIKWEHDFAQTGGEWACFGPLGYILGVWIIGPVLGLANLCFTLDPQNKVDLFLFVIDCYMVAYSLWLVMKNIGGKNPPMISNTRQSPISPK
ncbi:MAG: hypothetical protein JW749_13070 [Sedimentisphaerales bacterium]|nr:hypothetical protein [Sedimentisphaerales bacterium]